MCREMYEYEAMFLLGQFSFGKAFKSKNMERINFFFLLVLLEKRGMN
jgi:hypothetical protein